MLQSTALAGVLGMLPVGVVAGNSGRAKPNDDDTVVLGDFEDGLDGWRTNGGNELEQITDEQTPRVSSRLSGTGIRGLENGYYNDWCRQHRRRFTTF